MYVLIYILCEIIIIFSYILQILDIDYHQLFHCDCLIAKLIVYSLLSFLILFQCFFNLIIFYYSKLIIFGQFIFYSEFLSFCNASLQILHHFFFNFPRIVFVFKLTWGSVSSKFIVIVCKTLLDFDAYCCYQDDSVYYNQFQLYEQQISRQYTISRTSPMTNKAKKGQLNKGNDSQQIKDYGQP